MSSIAERIKKLQEVYELCNEHERVLKKRMEELHALQGQAAKGWNDEKSEYFFKTYVGRIISKIEEHHAFIPASKSLIEDKLHKLEALKD